MHAFTGTHKLRPTLHCVLCLYHWRHLYQLDRWERCLEWVWERLNIEHCTVKVNVEDTIERTEMTSDRCFSAGRKEKHPRARRWLSQQSVSYASLRST